MQLIRDFDEFEYQVTPNPEFDEAPRLETYLLDNLETKPLFTAYEANVGTEDQVLIVNRISKVLMDSLLKICNLIILGT